MYYKAMDKKIIMGLIFAVWLSHIILRHSLPGNASNSFSNANLILSQSAGFYVSDKKNCP